MKNNIQIKGTYNFWQNFEQLLGAALSDIHTDVQQEPKNYELKQTGFLLAELDVKIKKKLIDNWTTYTLPLTPAQALALLQAHVLLYLQTNDVSMRIAIESKLILNLDKAVG